MMYPHTRLMTAIAGAGNITAFIGGIALAWLLQAAAVETSCADEPRAGLPQVIDQLRSIADLLETMTPREYLQSADRK